MHVFVLDFEVTPPFFEVTPHFSPSSLQGALQAVIMRLTTMSLHPSKTGSTNVTSSAIYKNLEELMFKAVRGEDVQEVLDKVCDFYGNDFDRDRLVLHLKLKILIVNFPLPSSRVMST